ncbi:hypothetical protein ACTXN9_12600 [Corynebacterium casei]|uniref:Uncharacterized protein n=1 Tax=Corynebacterium casei LMG S-19264 TaxID=1285583 RepID=A0ABM5PLF0_9CORY|nr:hypothetical protein [Corynebacterium casei]MDN5807888.1 hypothetical protein [Brevibacterium sp.]MDN6172694.1 hypothetical protein [Yaniella sp.]AHI18636.1 hypothetical protein CCASEI_00255 [Corynebacterium casei LMG S-19264]MDN5783172.1 hypothetical protein [Corynebacterium casei]MDN5901619.1 hypothetical protein [Corynebacterium casei]
MKVKIVKQAEALPVRLVRDGSDDEVDEAAAVREVDLQKKFHWSFYDLADKLGITRPRATALRRHLGIDSRPDYVHVFEFGSQRHNRYSDNALTLMRDTLEQLDMDEIWKYHRPRNGGNPRPACTQPGCANTEAS